jgi:hypothetical protein
MTVQELARRLITLIFAGRNRMDMIRRELPRTERAGWGRSPFRIEREEDSPFREPSTVIGAAVQPNITLFSGGFRQLLPLLGFQGNGPNEPQ